MTHQQTHLHISTDLSVVLGGAAGQGIQTIEQELAVIAKRAGYFVFSTKEVMSRIRGGTNSTQIRFSAQPVAAPIDRIDICIPFTADAFSHLEKRFTDKTLIIADREALDLDRDVHNVPFSELSKEVGGAIYTNSIAVGIIAGLLSIELNLLKGRMKERFGTKGEKVVNKNIDSIMRGYDIGQALLKNEIVKLTIPKNEQVPFRLLVNGAEAVAFGAIAAGCDFVSSYPMSPSTSVLTAMAAKMHDFGIVVEQAEDEIAAINMALGAWYAGARAMVTTSGGGFALMCEGISLAAMIESPLVVHLAQSPGPATGLPTRTEQADLELVLYAGHGEFPRVIYAPGTLEQAFYCTARAFAIADRFQIPSIVLTDQFLMDSYMSTAGFDLDAVDTTKHIIKTSGGYKRFSLTKNGISPRGVPGYGESIVCVDSDEHTEEGYITEDFDLRTAMVDKRNRKADGVRREIIPPELVGNRDFSSLIVCWGSNYHIVREALAHLSPTVAMLHFSQVYPLHPDTRTYLERAERVVTVENNATGQFAKLLKLELGFNVQEHLLKYNGLPFSVEEVVDKINEISA